MGLIDMRTRSDAINDKTYRWILQLKDNFTKFSWATPLEHKEAKEVYKAVCDIFFVFGPPRILKSADDHEFINALTNSLQTDFPSKILHNTFYE